MKVVEELKTLLELLVVFVELVEAPQLLLIAVPVAIPTIGIYVLLRAWYKHNQKSNPDA